MTPFLLTLRAFVFHVFENKPCPFSVNFDCPKYSPLEYFLVLCETMDDRLFENGLAALPMLI